MIIINYKNCNNTENARHQAAEELRDEILCDSFMLQNPSKYISVMSHGRPVINIPGIDFSITHSGCLAAAAVCGKVTGKGKIVINAQAEKVGIDVENIRRNISIKAIEKISHRFFSAKECDLVFGLEDGETVVKSFLRVWTRKESICKMNGEGLLKLSCYDSESLPTNISVESREIISAGERYWLSICAKKSSRIF